MTERQDDQGGGPTSSVRAAAEEYRRAGVALCRIPEGQKNPMDKGWTTRSVDPAEFADGYDIGLVCGYPSRRTVGGADAYPVCVDIDDAGALALADQHLPPTGAMEGRPGKQKSHWWYFVTDVPPEAESQSPQASAAARREGRFAGPVAKQFRHRDTGKVLIDFQGTGRHAVGGVRDAEARSPTGLRLLPPVPDRVRRVHRPG